MATLFNESTVPAQPDGNGAARQRLLTKARVPGTGILLDRLTIAADGVALPGEVESSMWSVAVHPADPKLLFASASLGQIYRSSDGGENWIALKRRLGEIRHIVWLPG